MQRESLCFDEERLHGLIVEEWGRILRIMMKVCGREFCII